MEKCNGKIEMACVLD